MIHSTSYLLGLSASSNACSDRTEHALNHSKYSENSANDCKNTADVVIPPSAFGPVCDGDGGQVIRKFGFRHLICVIKAKL